MKKFLIGVFLLLAALSGCGQPPEAEALAEKGTLCGTLTAFKREGIYVQTENNVSYCFELPCGIDLSDFEVGDMVCVSYNTGHGLVVDHVAAVETNLPSVNTDNDDGIKSNLDGFKDFRGTVVEVSGDRVVGAVPEDPLAGQVEELMFLRNNRDLKRDIGVPVGDPVSVTYVRDVIPGEPPRIEAKDWGVYVDWDVRREEIIKKIGEPW